MANNDATVIVGKLSDEELQKSINTLVSNVETASKKMADAFDSNIQRMKQSLASLGNANVNMSGSSDGGSVKRTSNLKKEEEQGKAVAATYDNINKASKSAGQSASVWIQRDIDNLRSRNQELIYAINKYKNIEIRPVVKDDGSFRAAIDDIKNKIDETRRKLQEVPPTSPLGKQFSQELQNARHEYVELLRSKKAFDEQSKEPLRVAEIQKNKDAIYRLKQELENTTISEKKMEEAMVQGASSMTKYSESANKAYQSAIKLAYNRAINIPTNDIDLAITKYETLSSMLNDSRFMGVLSPAQIARARKEVGSLGERLEDVFAKQEKVENSAKAITTCYNVSKEDIKAMNNAIAQTTTQEEKRTQEIKASGIAAQNLLNTFSQLVRTEIHASSQKPVPFNLTDTNGEVIKLEELINRIRRAYYEMSPEERESPLGQSLLMDLNRARELQKNIDAYNRKLMGLPTSKELHSSNKRDIGETIGAYNVLTNIVSNLTKEYKGLSRAERNAAKGTELLDKIQAFQREIRDVQRTMNRPTSLKKAIGLDESTLDHINDKLQALRAYKGGLKITDEKQLDEMKQVDMHINRLQRDYDKLMAKNQQMVASNTALGRSWNYMKNRLAFYFSVGASTAFVKNLIEVRSQYEMNERALGILIGSAERGTEIFQQLSQMALVSPYTLIELSSAAKQLTAYDIAAKDVVDTTRRLADMASAVGVPMERLTYALGQIKAYGYLNSRDARMFANAGIPLVKQLSEYYTQLEGKMVSVGDVYDRMKKKAIDFNSVMAVVTKMTDEGGKFFDFQAKMADTLKVRLANLTLAWNNMLNEMGAETQGVLTTGINLLKTLFLQWKNINAALSNIGWAVGIRTAIMFIAWAAINAGKAFGVWNKEMALSAVVGKKLAGILTTLTRSLVTIATSKITWLAVLAMAAIDAYNGLMGVNKAMEQLNSSLRKAAEDNYNNITKFLEQYKNLKNSLYEQMEIPIGKTGKYAQVQVAKDIDQGEAKKAWEAIREEIELTTRNSEEYIGNLLTIENISERVRQGFAVLEDLKVVNAALKDIGDDTIKIDNDFEILFFNIKDGLVTNLKDLKDYENGIIKLYGSVDNARKKFEGLDRALWSTAWQDYNREVENLRKNIETTTRSILDFIELKGWSGDVGKINEVFKQITDKIVLDNQLDPQKAFMLQEQVEEARSKAAKVALVARINDEAAAYRAAQDKNAKEAILIRYNELKEEYDKFEQFNGKSRVYWTNFTKWLKEQHLSEMTEMFRGMDAEQIKSINFQEGKYGEWVNRMVTKYAKEHKMSIDDVESHLKNFVRNANQMSIFIPLTISTEDKKSVLKTLEEADAAYEAAKKNIERLEIRKKQLEEKGATTNKAVKDQTADDKELIQLEQELIAEQKSLADSEAKGGRSKKEATEARRAQHQAESELQKALKDEMQLIDKVRSSYKKLTDDSVSHEEAISLSTDGFEKSVAEINKTLSKFGVKKIDLSKFAGITNPQELVNLLQEQLNAIMKSGAVKPVEIKDFEAKIKDLKLDAKSFDQKTFAESLNNSLNRLKDEYELAIALDADPELGNMFADMMGVNTEDLPHTVQEYANEYTKYLNKYLAENGSKVELPHLNLTDDDLKMFEEMVKENKLNANLYEKIAAAVKDVREKTNKDISETIKSWDKLIEKYGEYEARINAIRNDAAKERVELINKAGTEQQKSTAVRLLTKLQATDDPQEKQNLEDDIKALVAEIAQKDGSILKLSVAIDNEQLRQSATEAYKEFRESPIWSIANGNLAGMTHNALGGLITSIEKFKKTTKGLDGKQLKEIDRVVRSLRKQQREGNPFLAIGNAIDEAKARAEDIQPELDKIMKQIVALEEKRADGNALSEEEEKELKSLKQQWKDLWKTGNLEATEVVGFINQCISAGMQAVSMFNDMLTALSGSKWNEAQEILGDVASTIEKAGQGAAIGAQVGGGWGAAIGAVAGGLMGAITAFADNANKKINKQIEDSETAVKRLEVAYVDLQHTMEEAYGSGIVASKRLMASMKQLELAELERQLALERSRSQKNKDEGKISDLQKQIKELRYEIEDTITEITDELLGSDAGGFAEGLVDAMIAAFKNGEDYMKVFEEKFDEMIDNMIMKSITSKVVAQYIDSLWDSMDDRIKNRSQNEAANLAAATKRREQLENMDVYSYAYEEHGIGKFGLEQVEEVRDKMQKLLDTELQAARMAEETAQKAYDSAMEMNDSDISYLISKLAEIKPELGEKLREILGEYYKFGETSNKELSALQQGISGITEDTAGALEAYMNGVSQQVYLQSDILSQIRDAVVGFNMDIQVASMSQILLQLRSSYEIQMSIHSLLEGWNNPAGNAVRVELV